ncbi:membrane protein [Clostridia bacterium]|nr:membrane protein [Clostridia bacterium]
MFKNLLSVLKSKIKSFNSIRQNNTEKYKKVNLILMIVFPLFICSMAEINQGKTLSRFFDFIVHKPSVFLFDLVLWGAIFAGLLFLFKKGWIAVLTQSAAMFSLSIIELFKFNTNGNHLILADMSLAKSIKSMTSFAYIKITVPLVVYFIIVLAFFITVFWFNPVIHEQFKKRLPKFFALITPVALVVCIPAIGMPVYRVFGIDTKPSINNFVENEKFACNSFLAFFTQTATENFFDGVKKPANYSAETIANLITVENKTKPETFDVKPNVIVVMSESFADFRKFETDGLVLPVSNAYDAIDRVGEQGYKGTAIVPTFASFTVRTEFELNFGLPVRSLNDPNMPQRELTEKDQTTIARYYKEQLGYTTAYIHPFISTFYSRAKLYPYFDFDNLIFDEDFTVPVETFTSGYYSDKTVYNQIEQLLVDNDKPMFIHTTTMQNHQPYVYADGDDEFTNYLNGMKESSDQFEEFTKQLTELDEPTVVLFIGDHFPSLRGESSVYEQLGLNGTNCSPVYEQNFVVWANYDFDYSSIPHNTVSLFYIPYTIIDAIDAPTNNFIRDMLIKMRNLPVYSTCYDNSVGRDEFLDTITYDRVYGEDYSS